jgi:hypothetical protein
VIWNADDMATFIKMGDPGDELWICEPGSNDRIPGGIVASVYTTNTLVVYTTQQMYKRGEDGAIRIVQVPQNIVEAVQGLAWGLGKMLFTSPEYPLSEQAKAQMDFTLNTRGLH